MAQQPINNGDSGLISRTKINANDAELYSTKVDKVVGKDLSDENYTLAEKNKLATVESSKWLGEYVSLGALQIANPAPVSGSYGYVDTGVGQDIQSYIWDTDDTKYVLQLGESTSETPASIKTKYESNADTNAYTNSEKTKVGNISVTQTVDLDVIESDTNLNNSHRTTVTGNPHAVTQTEVGLDQVDNTSDLDKPISTDTQTALDGKMDTAGSFDSIELNPQSPAVAYQEGLYYYDDDNKAHSFYVESATLPPVRAGRVLRSRVMNNESFTIVKGDIVKIVGVSGTSPIVELSQANNIDDVKSTVGMIMEDILTGGIGYVAVFDTIVGVNTLGSQVNDLVYLDPDNAGKFTFVQPKAPDYSYPFGFVSIVDEFNGVIGVRFGGFTNTDTSTNIEGSLNGIVTQEQHVDFVVDTGVAYADVYNENFPTKNLPFMIGSKMYFLDTLTGTGVGGSARVALTNGTINSPQKNYIYIELVGEVPTLKSSTILPIGSIALVGWVSIFDIATTTTDGIFSWQRNNNSVDNGDGDGILNYITDRLRYEGSKYITGVLPTVIIDTGVAPDSVKVSTSVGVITQLHAQTFDPTGGDVYYIVNHPTEPFKKITDLNEIDVIADGTPLSDNDRLGLNLMGVQNSNGELEKILVNLPEGAYTTDATAINDSNNFSVTGVPVNAGITLNTFRICRLVLRYDTQGGGQWTNLLGAGLFQDERGFPLGLGGSGATTGLATTEFSDGAFSWFNALDSTKTTQVDLSGITTATNRTVAIQDQDGTMALLSDTDAKVEWLFPWIDATYNKNTMTRIGDWTSISNIQTSDYPVPIESGLPLWGIVPDPSWTTSQVLGDGAYGYDITTTVMGSIKGWRIWATGDTDTTYTVQLWDYNNENNPILLGTDFIDVNTPIGWVEVLSDEPSIVTLPGNRFRLSVLIHATTTDTEYNGTWTNVDGGAVPSDGIVTLNTAVGVKVFIDKNELDLTDRGVELLLLKEGDTIKFTETADSTRFSLYRVTGTSVNQGTYVELPVSLLDEGNGIRGGKDVLTDWTVYGADTNTDYVEDAGNLPTYFPSGNVKGFFTTLYEDVTDPALTLNDNVYGVDLLVDEYTQSSDWDIVAYSGNSGGASGSISRFEDGKFAIYNSADVSKEVDFNLSNISTSTIRTINIPDEDGSLLIQKLISDSFGIETKLIDTFDHTINNASKYSYEMNNGVLFRSGELKIITNGAIANISDVSIDIGDSSGISFDVAINANDVELSVTSDSASWTIKLKRELI